jgi:hypothetical protein
LRKAATFLFAAVGQWSRVVRFIPVWLICFAVAEEIQIHDGNELGDNEYGAELDDAPLSLAGMGVYVPETDAADVGISIVS